MDFHTAFGSIDTDGSGCISKDELEVYMKQQGYKEEFLQKWLDLFDIDGDGEITYNEYCETLGIKPLEDMVKLHKDHHYGTQGDTQTTCAISGIDDDFGLPMPVMQQTPMQVDDDIMVSQSVKKQRSKKSGNQKKSDDKPQVSKKITKSEQKEQEFGDEENLIASIMHKKSTGKRRGQSFSVHKRNFRSSLRPGTILILLVGRHRGKRVVLLRNLDYCGLLLVTGPYKCNGVCLRRVHPKMVIATSTRIEGIENDLELPNELLGEDYFRREIADQNKNELLVSDDESNKYKPSEQKKKDQMKVDTDVIKMIKDRDDGKIMLKYLKSQFKLMKHDLPHKMCF